ncbi:MAG: metal ABC transporter solute-binding protein, Zn/Mn family [Burkholderiaceae bacterium]
MRIRSSHALIGGLLLTFASHVPALQVFTCEPEWAALVRTLVPSASVVSATHADQDPHHIEARPSLIAALRRADLAVCTGASLEVGWLPMLQTRAGNSVVRDGAPGMFYAANHTDLLDAGGSADRAHGDVHPEGNPHVHLDPYRVIDIARALAATLIKIDPSIEAETQERLKAFEADWAGHRERWTEARTLLKGRSIVVQHSAFRYLLAFLGVEAVADLEPLPGLPPTLSHLRTVLDQVSDKSPIAIIQTRYQSPQPGNWLAERTGMPLLSLPSTVTDDSESDELPELINRLVEQIVENASR